MDKLTNRQLKHLEDYYFNISRGLPSTGINGGIKTQRELIAKGYLIEVPADETGETSEIELTEKGIMFFEKEG